MDKMVNLLDDAITKAYADLKKYEPGTKQYAATMLNVEKLTKLRTEAYKATENCNLEAEKAKTEAFYTDQKQQLEAERIVKEDEREKKKLWVSIGSAAGMGALYLIALFKTTHYEEFSVANSKVYPGLPKWNIFDALIKKK